jgi:hypothetical protein
VLRIPWKAGVPGKYTQGTWKIGKYDKAAYGYFLLKANDSVDRQHSATLE